MNRLLPYIALLAFFCADGSACGQSELVQEEEPTTPAESAPAPAVPPPSAERLQDLTSRLNNDDFKTRESAQIELAGLARQHPDQTFDTVLSDYLTTADPEARFRLRSVLYNAKMEQFATAPRGFVGIMMYPSQAFTPEGGLIYAIQIRQVVAESAAEKAGLQLMDQILEVDGRKFESHETSTANFASYIMGKAPGEPVEMTIRRANQDLKVNLTLGQRPKDSIEEDPRIQLQFQREFKEWLEENSARLRGEE